MPRLGGLLLVPAVAAVLAAQTQVPRPAPATAHVAGRVVDAATGAPVPGAVVKMGPRTRTVDRHGKLSVNLTVFSPNHRFTMTDAEGRFAFDAVEPDMVILAAEASGYQLSAYGQVAPDAPARQLFVGEGQQLTSFVIRTWRSGAITGTVRDEAGEPVVDAPVRAMRRRFDGGARRLVADAEARTDDRGIYRIVDLVPGEYVVAVSSAPVTISTSFADEFRQAMTAGNRDAVTRLTAQARALRIEPLAPGIAVADGFVMATSGLWPPASTRPASLVYPTTFHPSVTSPEHATIVNVRSADERSGVDLQLAPVRAFRVSGRLSSVEGSVANTRVALVARSTGLLAWDSEIEVAVTQTGADGTFLFVGVPEGSYVMRAIGNPDGPPTGVETVWAETPLEVDADLTNVTVGLQAGVRLRGRLVFEGSAAVPDREGALQVSNVHLVAVDGRSPERFRRATVRADRTFVTPGYPPGRYYVAAWPVGQWYLKSAVVGGRDALREPIELRAADLTNAVITYTDSVFTVFGTVVGSVAGSEDEGGTIVLVFPAAIETWIGGGMNPLLVHEAITFSGGMFRIPRLVPGDYLIAAYDADARRNPYDPAFIRKVAPLATRVSLSDPDTSGLTVQRVSIR